MRYYLNISSYYISNSFWLGKIASRQGAAGSATTNVLRSMQHNWDFNNTTQGQVNVDSRLTLADEGLSTEPNTNSEWRRWEDNNSAP